MNKLSYKKWEDWYIKTNCTVTEEQIESMKTQYYCGLNTYEEFKRLLEHEYKQYCNPSSMNYNNFQMYKRPMNVFEKLHSGWWWIGEIFDEWCYTMTHDDGEFFIYLQSDYVRYEEDFYYTKDT